VLGCRNRQHSLRLCCGNGLRADVWTKFKERFSIPHTIEFYAASEDTFSLFNIEEEPGATEARTSDLIKPFMNGCSEANYASNSRERLLHGRNAFLALLHSECLLQVVSSIAGQMVV
jgi:hypothetical protein